MSPDPDHPASQRQRAAADPCASTWLTANAGSGKTSVLIDRVARLLLQDVEPQRILCLTYTKAAATEMQNRLFKRLGQWAMLPETALLQQLSQLGHGEHLTDAGLRAARRLFARALETPGGLKIQTIHSFCAALLRRFPLEAGVAPHFVEMDDQTTSQVRAEILSEMADGPDLPLVDALARHVTAEDFTEITKALTQHRSAFVEPLSRGESLGLFDLPAGFSTQDLLASVFLGDEDQILHSLLPALRQGSTNDVKAADSLAEQGLLRPNLGSLAVLEGLFLNKSGANPGKAKIGSFPTKATRQTLAPLMPALDDLMARIEAARPRRLALLSAERNAALHSFAAAFLPQFEARKAARGWLDFDDLILKARTLLTDSRVAQWVLFRLDGGIDHILIDEAQDTSPDQWQVIKLLAEEFHAGRGARDTDRTIFVVGDKKQSIYSFQGADLAAFDRMRDHFAHRTAAVGQDLAELSLDYSFRSSPLILSLVDATLAKAEGLGESVRHLAFNKTLPGRVDLWPFRPKSAEPEEREWFDPVDLPTDQQAPAVLAAALAQTLRTLIDAGTMIPTRAGVERLHEGHILILVQRRSALFGDLIRACKAANLAIAGADRLKLGAELAVRDLTALLAFVDTPEDDLSLAAALRSPLLGWSEDRLYRLAQPRGAAYLWQALRAEAADHLQTHALLTDLRDQADFLRPYELLERILTRHRGRLNLLARLGPEAEDGIDELLSQALRYEQTAVPSLTGFLSWLGDTTLEIKRQPGTAARAIRVMTVHGAKGLESPMVILPDTASRTLQAKDELFRFGQTSVLWKSPAADSPPLMDAIKAQVRAAQAEENMRLLYVAMTRAESWLIIAGAGNAGEEGAGKGWYDLAAQGFAREQLAGLATAEPLSTPIGLGARLSYLPWPDPAPTSDPTAPTHTPLPDPSALPAWAISPAPPAKASLKPLAPSGLGGAKILPGDPDALPEAEALRRGRQLHLLLEHLPLWPRPDWPDQAGALLAASDEAATPAEVAATLREATMVLLAPHLTHLFAPSALSEVGISAPLPELSGRTILGTIDRLLVEPSRVLAIDYKSNAGIPPDPAAVPLGLLRQMGAYAAALSQIYPDRRIENAILWTRTATLMPLPPDLVMAALRATIS